MAQSQEVMKKLIGEGLSKGILSNGREDIPEELWELRIPVCEMVNRGITAYCKGNDQLSMIPMLTIQLSAYAGMAAYAERGTIPSCSAEDFAKQLTQGRPVEELGTVSWELQGIEPGCELANRVDDHIRALYIKALLSACDDGPMDQVRVMEAAGGMYGYGVALAASFLG